MADTPTTAEPAPASGISQTEFDRRIEAARSEEKAKLYQEIQKLKNQITELQAAPKTADTVDQTAALRIELGELTKQLAIAEEKARQEVKVEREARLALELQLYRERKIAELRANNTGFIEKLIAGSTIAEIDAAIVGSTQAYSQVQADIAAKQDAATRATPLPGGPGSGPNAPKPGTVAPTPVGNLTEREIKSLSPAEYAKHRESLTKAALGG